MNRVLLLFTMLMLAVSVSGAEPKHASPGYQFSFPRDHGKHNDYGTEWWYVTGHLDGNYGFELTFFRVGLDRKAPSESAWAAENLYLAHFAVTTPDGFLFSEKAAREVFSKAGAADDNLKVWIDSWYIELEEGVLTLKAEDKDKALRLRLTPQKGVVLHGEKGFSKKSETDASLYSSFTRLTGQGELRIKDRTHSISRASAWLDHETFTSSNQRGAVGWDWFALQLENNTELMVYQLRDESGKPTDYSSGSFISEDGTVTTLKSGEFKITPLKKWKSEASGITYPSLWDISVPAHGVNVKVTPTIPDQEIPSTNFTGVSYWEGRSIVSGSHRGEGYVELVGYR